MRKRALAAALGMTLMVLGGSQLASAASGPFKWVITFRGADENAPGRVVSTGAINAVGRDVNISESRTRSVEKIIFPRGTLTLTTHTTRESGREVDAACLASFSFGGTFKITNGTGEYKGAKGGGTFSGKGTFQGRRLPNGECSEREGTVNVVVTASGSLRVPERHAA